MSNLFNARAIIVCVDYWDYLELSLPRSTPHFKEVWVVTSLEDVRTVEVASRFGAKVVQTNLFYEEGAFFNKYKALEHGLDMMDRWGWLCLLDSDIILPSSVPAFEMEPGNLYTPPRRMLDEPPAELMTEESWQSLPYGRDLAWGHFSGYFQLFHAADPVLGPAPWHQTNWKHAGGADTFFQQKWPASRRIRPPFSVLHLGAAGRNWCGRATRFLDGSTPQLADQRAENHRNMQESRRRSGRRDDFRSEKY